MPKEQEKSRQVPVVQLRVRQLRVRSPPSALPATSQTEAFHLIWRSEKETGAKRA